MSKLVLFVHWLGMGTQPRPMFFVMLVPVVFKTNVQSSYYFVAFKCPLWD